LNAQITFSENSIQLHIPLDTAGKAAICLLTEKIPEEPEESILNMVLDAVIPLVSASQKPSEAINVTPVKTELKLGAKPVSSLLEWRHLQDWSL